MITKRRLDSIPQWFDVGWKLSPDELLSDLQIYRLYRKNWSNVQTEKLNQDDMNFINELGKKYGEYQEFTPLPHWADMTIQERQSEAWKQEKQQELLDLVLDFQSQGRAIGKLMPADFDAEDFVAQWIHKKHPRLDDRPSDLFFSQDGFAAVEHELRWTIREMLFESNTH